MHLITHYLFFKLDWTSDRTALSILFIGLAILASALPFSLEMLALRNLTPLSFGTLMSLEPAVAALSGFIFLGEYLLWNHG
ncbi:EamA family transporter [Acinetobacter seifertii]|nr:EamA family transporter [Acinetobacter seifertii]